MSEVYVTQIYHADQIAGFHWSEASLFVLFSCLVCSVGHSWGFTPQTTWCQRGGAFEPSSLERREGWSSQEPLALRLRCFWTPSDLFGCPRPSPKAVSSLETNSSSLEDSGNETTLSMCHPELTLFHFLSCVSHSCWCVCSCSGTPASLHKAVFQSRGSNYMTDGTQIEVSDQVCMLLTPLGPR